MQQDNSVVVAMCREWERITGGGRYRLRVGGGRVEIAQFRAPLNHFSVVFDRKIPMRLDFADLARFAQIRKVGAGVVRSEIEAYCQSVSEQWSNLVIADTTEY
jgi:hypothetical protein